MAFLLFLPYYYLDWRNVIIKLSLKDSVPIHISLYFKYSDFKIMKVDNVIGIEAFKIKNEI